MSQFHLRQPVYLFNSSRGCSRGFLWNTIQRNFIENFIRGRFSEVNFPWKRCCYLFSSFLFNSWPMRNRVGKTQTFGGTFFGGKKRKIPSFLPLFREKKKNPSFSPFSFHLRWKTFLHTKEESWSIPFSRKVSVEGEHARRITFLAWNLPSSTTNISQGGCCFSTTSPHRFVSKNSSSKNISQTKGTRFVSFFPLFSNYKSVKMFSRRNEEIIFRWRHASVFDTDVTALLRVAAHILTVTEFLGRFRFTTVLKSGQGLRWRSSRLVYNFVALLPLPSYLSNFVDTKDKFENDVLINQ